MKKATYRSRQVNNQIMNWIYDNGHFAIIQSNNFLSYSHKHTRYNNSNETKNYGSNQVENQSKNSIYDKK